MKIIALCLVAVAFFSASCTKQTTAENNSNEQKVTEVLTSKAPYSQRTALLDMLNENEKASLWKRHLYPFLSKKGLTKDQFSILNEVFSFIQPAIFRPENKAAVTGQLAMHEYKAKAAFPLKDYFLIFEMFTSGVESLEINDPETPISTLPINDCYCRSNSWCGSATGSDLAMCLWNNEGSSCNTTNSGCGMIGWSECRGVCCVGSNCYPNY